MSYDQQKSLYNTGIALIVLGVFVLLAGVWGVLHIANNARIYTADATGTVVKSLVQHDYDDGGTTTYSNITVEYDGLDGTRHTFERRRLGGEYKEGEKVALKCTEDLNKAVLKIDTEQDPVFICCINGLGLWFGIIGVVLVKKKLPVKCKRKS
jgi:hypothetical protein